ncbi:MAG: isoleucine--tRNA ligase [Bdellovibrionota bacterium]
MCDSQKEKNSLVETEKKILKYWEDNKCYEALRKSVKGGKVYRFLDGPITANSAMGIHHAFGRTLKDIFLKYKWMNGYDVRFRNGFDTQGLWIEVEVEKELGFKTKKDIEDYGLEEFTKRCNERVEKYTSIITEQSKRLGQWADWDDSYYTGKDYNIEAIWHFLKVCNEKGMIDKSYRPMMWCPRCGTSLSEHEMTGSYKDVVHTSIFLKLPIKGESKKIIVWTTTPWTLSSNVALAVNPNNDYCEVKVKSDNEHIILGKEALGVLGDDRVEIVRFFKGSELIGKEYTTCFEDFEAQQGFVHKIVSWDEVSAKEGSGVVHIAPGCGAEDFELGEQLGLPKIMPVDDNGIFLEKFGFLTGKNVKDVRDIIFKDLENRNMVYKLQEIVHPYPICWRCKEEIIFRLIDAWYIKVDDIREDLINASKTVNWEPEYLGKRMQDWLTNMGDWNISRKRFYGLPLPFYVCDKCGKLTVIGSKKELRALATNKDMVDKLPELHRPFIDKINILCPDCQSEVSRVLDTGDVWLDAGIVSFSTQEYFTNKKEWEKYFPAEFITEMREQVRLWFYSLLFMSVVLEGKAPYERVLGFSALVKEDGSKFSKTSKDNIKFHEAADKVGSDTIRYLYAGANYTNDIRFGWGLLDEARRKLMSFNNICTFFDTYASLDKPDLENFKIDKSKFAVSDLWLLARNNQFIRNAKNYMDNYQSNMMVKDLEFFIDDVSNWYIRINRRRFWKSSNTEDKLIGYYCLFEVIKTITRVLAPIVPFMCEDIFLNIIKKYEKNDLVTVLLFGYPKENSEFDNDEIINNTKVLRDIITLALRVRNEANLKVRQPLSKLYILTDNNEHKDFINSQRSVILEELNIQDIEFIRDESALVDEYLTLNFKVAGSVLKKDVQKVKDLLGSLTFEDMQKLVKDFNEDKPLFIKGFKEELSKEIFTKLTCEKENIKTGKENGVYVALNTYLTHDLILEGIVREIIRNLQVLRKDSGFAVEQKISVGISSSLELVKEAVDKFKEKIMSETLALSLTEKLDVVEGENVIEVNEGSVVIQVCKIS